MKNLFGTSGIRRLADKELVQIAFRTGLAVGRQYRNVVIGRDTRTTGSALRHAVIAGLLSAGATCADAGIVTTPTLAYATRHYQAGIMITASHNPPEYNGLKLFNPDGSSFSVAQQVAITREVTRDWKTVPWHDFRTDVILENAVADHTARILQNMPRNIPLTVVIDCAGSAGCTITPHLLQSLGCEVIGLHTEPTGIFPRDVEPVEANLGELCQKVRETGAALGITHDGDADRMMAVDNRGRYIPGDKLLVLFARSAGDNRVVTTIDASMSLERCDFNVLRTPVGDPYVSEKLLQEKLPFGGEPSGAWVFADLSYCPDGPYAAARLVHLASRIDLAEAIDSIPAYPVRRGNVRGTGLNMAKLRERLDTLHPESVLQIDGLKLNFADGWLLVRPSGTEPKIRITAEALTEGRVNILYETGVKIVRELLSDNA